MTRLGREDALEGNIVRRRIAVSQVAQRPSRAADPPHAVSAVVPLATGATTGRESASQKSVADPLAR